MPDGEYTLDEVLQEEIPKNAKAELDHLRSALKKLQERRRYVAPVRLKTNTIRFGVISDLQAGSLYERFDALSEFYKILKSEKIENVLIVGDILDGHGMYKGQEFEIYAHGVRRQLEVLKKRFPKSDRRHFFITGNHDYSFDKLVDLGIGDAIARRMGWIYLGRDQATIPLKTVGGQILKVGLYHPDGGTAYALSYKPQKLVEAIPGGQKPDILFIGHYHKAEWLPEYRNVSVFQSGCFQSQTPYMARKPTPAHVGGWIIEVIMGNRSGLTSRVKPEFISFYEPGEIE